MQLSVDIQFATRLSSAIRGRASGCETRHCPNASEERLGGIELANAVGKDSAAQRLRLNIIRLHRRCRKRSLDEEVLKREKPSIDG